MRILERLMKYCGHLERAVLGFGQAPAKAQVQSNPVTEPKRSQKAKRPLPSSLQLDGYSISLNVKALDSESRRYTPLPRPGLSGMAAVAVASIFFPAQHALATDSATNAVSTAPSDPVLGLMLEKGMITEDEANRVQALADARRTNMAAEYAPENSRWKISPGIKSVELFGDLRVRYEGRSETAPFGGQINDDRFRYSVRLGLRGDALEDFYYGFRLETSSNPRSTWVTMASSSPDPYGKSAAGINIGQVYLGWKPASWLDLTIGKMPNPLYTSSMVWSPSINPEGLAEHLKYSVGTVDFFANFAQFLYQDENPDVASPGLGLAVPQANNLVQIAWQAGFNARITTNLSARVAGTVYKYYGMEQTSANNPTAYSPYYGDNYVGEGAYSGVNIANNPNGYSGYVSGSSQTTLLGYYSANYPNNQVGLDYLTVLEFPLEINYRFKHFDTRLFGDFAYNLEGANRARAAATGYADYLVQQASSGNQTIKAFSPQTQDVKAYQIGLAVASPDSLGLVNGAISKKHAWEARAYWQHIEQYSLDPNLLDLDYMAGAENLEGVYAALAYGFSGNFIGTFRYGYASRINHLLGTGGTGTDIPQINPINSYQLFQVDLTFKF
jgi:hypothetical protein